MNLKLFDKVSIPDKRVTGTIVDVYSDDKDNIVYVIQSDKRGYVDDPDSYTGDFPLYDCCESQLRKM